MLIVVVKAEDKEVSGGCFNIVGGDFTCYYILRVFEKSFKDILCALNFPISNFPNSLFSFVLCEIYNFLDYEIESKDFEPRLFRRSTSVFYHLLEFLF